MATERASGGASTRSDGRPRRRATPLSVIGELLLTIGLVMLLFVGWQHFLGDQIMGQMQNEAAEQVIDAWEISDIPPNPDAQLNTTDPPPAVTPPTEIGEAMGVLYIPRFGPDFQRVIGQGTERWVLDALDLGVGHYESTQMPGEVGNFAVAAHRNGRGGPFTTLDQLQVGDHIYVLTQDTWYVYQFRNTEYVDPHAVEVLLPVPQQPGAAATDRIMTLTTCNPIGSIAGRLIGFAVFVGWQPASDGMPAMLQAELAGEL